MTCLNCRAETSNGLALCDLCQRKAAADLEFIPVYFRNLARWRPGRAGSRPVPGSRVLWDGSAEKRGDRIADALDEVANAVTTWARALSDDRGDFARPLTMANAVLAGDTSDEVAEQLNDDQPLMIAWLCVALEHHSTSIATLDWCGEFVRELGRHEQILRGLTEVSIPGWYAGACRRCTIATYVVPGLTWVTCGGCGATTYARDHLDVVLSEARDWVAPPKRIAEALVALLDSEMSVPRLYDRIRQWASRERFEPVHEQRRDYVWSDTSERFVVATIATGRARYRLGDVLDELLAEGATRTASEQTSA